MQAVIRIISSEVSATHLRVMKSQHIFKVQSHPTLVLTLRQDYGMTWHFQVPKTLGL